MRGLTGNLPQELTSFVGRRHELEEVKRLLADSRLLTLVGVGGVGKTRLALRAAAALRREYSGGVWLVELDQVQDEGLVAPAVARALGVREQAGVGPAAVLRELLADRPLLLVLDNCEHLHGGVVALVEMLLRETSQLRILATSRQPLNVRWETTHPVSPLSVPQLRAGRPVVETADYEAVTLFTERAQVVVAGFELGEDHRAAVTEICSRLEGLPLAIELAVARLPVLSPQQIRDRLSDRALLTGGRRTAPPRQQTLRGCIQWSHDLCTPDEQVLWARLSVFAGDFDLEAVEGVCGGGHLPAEGLPALITSLVDKSILIAQPGPSAVMEYRMLESIRSYGRERLGDSDEESTLRRRHRDWHQQVADRFRAEWIGAHQLEWLQRLDRIMPDIWAALEFSLNQPEPTDAALAIVADLRSYWVLSGLLQQARTWLGRALTPTVAPSPVHLAALVCEAGLAGMAGDVAAVNVRVHQAWEEAGHLGDAHSRAMAAKADAWLATARGDLPGAVVLYRDALGVFRAEGDLYRQAIVLVELTLTQVLLEDLAGASECCEAMLALGRPRGESFYCGLTTMTLGIGLWKHGDLDAAGRQVRQGLQLLQRTGVTVAVSWCLKVMAWIAASQGEPRRAATLLGAAAALAQTMGPVPPIWPHMLSYQQRWQQQAQNALGETAFDEAFEHGRSLAADDAVSYALARGCERTRPAPARPPAGSGPMSALTRREREVAALLAQGRSNKEIAAQLVISPRTAEGHVDRVIRKLAVDSRADVAALLVSHARQSGPRPS
jgi:predicted ATPase/DNA-binding CsgD family transcriptional regulator